MRRSRNIMLAVAFALLLGCGTGDTTQNFGDSSGPPQVSWANALPDADGKVGFGGMGMGADVGMGGGMGMGTKQSTQESSNAIDSMPSSHNRRVIFNSSIELQVKNFDGIESMLSDLVQRHGGFISAADVSSSGGQRRSGNWTVRVPVGSYRQLLDSVGGLGELVSRNEEATDVTSEFYDLEARIKNKKLLEDRIVKLLDEADSELRKLIEVEHELARVREEIERMQGKLRYLADVTGMSTIRIQINEGKQPPAPVVAVTFADRIEDAWNGASTQATNTLENFAVAIVRNAFNIALTFVLLVFVWLFSRRLIWHLSKRDVDSTPIVES